MVHLRDISLVFISRLRLLSVCHHLSVVLWSHYSNKRNNRMQLIVWEIDIILQKAFSYVTHENICCDTDFFHQQGGSVLDAASTVYL